MLKDCSCFQCCERVGFGFYTAKGLLLVSSERVAVDFDDADCLLLVSVLLMGCCWFECCNQNDCCFSVAAGFSLTKELLFILVLLYGCCRFEC